jgi:putative phosphoribosyl transferase
LNDEVMRYLGGNGEAFEAVRAREQDELERRERAYRGSRPPLEMIGHTAILIDDGLATGATMEAAVRALQSLGAGRVVVAVPVASVEARERIEAVADEVVCLASPGLFSAVGQWYADFDQTGDEEVRDLLARARKVAQRSRPAEGGEP